MVDTLEFASNRFKITKDGKTTFDSNAKSVQLFPDSTKLIFANKQIVFPNLLQTNAYHRYENSSELGAGKTYCESWSALVRQEWGPTEANFNYIGHDTNGISTRLLAQELLGTVPPETDYLDVRIRLNRTHVPAVMWDQAPPYVLFEEGDWVNLPGGSCPTEAFRPMLFRHFDVVREIMPPIGGVPQRQRLWLRRYQSVGNKGYVDRVMPSGGTIIDSDASVSGGWTVNDEGAWPNAPARAAWLACRIQSKGPDTNPGGKRRNGVSPGTDNQCLIPGKTTSYPDLGSIYTGDIVIWPGRYE